MWAFLFGAVIGAVLTYKGAMISVERYLLETTDKTQSSANAMATEILSGKYITNKKG